MNIFPMGTPEDLQHLADELGISDAAAHALSESLVPVAAWWDDRASREGHPMAIAEEYPMADDTAIRLDRVLRENLPPTLKTMLHQLVLDHHQRDHAILARLAPQLAATPLLKAAIEAELRAIRATDFACGKNDQAMLR